MEENDTKSHVSVHWFRHGLRLHDNPALLDSLENCREFYPVFILDGNVAGISSAAFPRMQFLFETLQDLDDNLRSHGSRLFVLRGKPVDVFAKMFEEWGVTRLTFEQDPEPVWQERDNSVKALCDKQNVEWIERVSHMLWEPRLILEENGGEPPLTYAMFNQVAQVVGPPPKPVGDPDFSGISLPCRKDDEESYKLPSLEEIDIRPESEEQASPFGRYLGGETKALKLLSSRLEKEHEAFSIGQCLPTQLNPNLIGMPMSLSPHLRFGSLSVRKFYWSLRDTFSQGQTGFPWIDACMRQLLQEGWIHQVCRHAVACFLTRGDLWIDWQKGLKVFDRYLLDADWSVCAGNWMWVSSSAFEKVLQCPRCICPVRYGKRIDPTGAYVRRYVPELKRMPLQYLFEPWKAPLKLQEEVDCIIGKDYPEPMVDHRTASKECKTKMEAIKKVSKDVPHIAPANEEEVLTLMWSGKQTRSELMDACTHNLDKICL
ncbi:cryptochrome-1 isoform X2 [Aplysia californica]|uniref:Cryptochrome-1 n=1 Tax=Aplysia californica TaxID=6500 RepID=A0ABM1VSZ2_APLCA|nr:cryptochrome-1 isoform X2 [Aplysia californica]